MRSWARMCAYITWSMGAKFLTNSNIDHLTIASASITVTDSVCPSSNDVRQGDVVYFRNAVPTSQILHYETLKHNMLLRIRRVIRVWGFQFATLVVLAMLIWKVNCPLIPHNWVKYRPRSKVNGSTIKHWYSSRPIHRSFFHWSLGCLAWKRTRSWDGFETSPLLWRRGWQNVAVA